MKIIGIGGTDGSGKDTVGEMLAEGYGWLFISVTDLLREEATKRKLKLDRSILRQISAEWRRESGLAVLVDKALQAFEPQKTKYRGLAIASLRHPAEAERIHESGGKVIWTDANPEVRYNRITARNRGTEDHKTFEEFLAEEKAQMNHSGDEATLSLGGVKAKADIFIKNDGSDIEAFKKAAQKILHLA